MLVTRVDPAMWPCCLPVVWPGATAAFRMATAPGVGSQYLLPLLFIPSRLGVQPLPPHCHSLVWQLLDGATVFLHWNITFQGFSFPLLTDVRCRDRFKMKAWLPESNYTAIKSNQRSGSLCWRRGLWKGFLFQLILEKLKCPVSSAVWPLTGQHLHRVGQALLKI